MNKACMIDPSQDPEAGSNRKATGFNLNLKDTDLRFPRAQPQTRVAFRIQFNDQNTFPSIRTIRNDAAACQLSQL
jgi:hypothetical protein